MVWLGLGTNTPNGSGWEQIMFSNNKTENCLKVSVKISSGFTLTNTGPLIQFSIGPPLMSVIRSSLESVFTQVCWVGSRSGGSVQASQGNQH